MNNTLKTSSFLPVLLIAVLGFAVYLNSLNGKFIWDDYALVRDNAHIKDLAYSPKLFTEKISAGYAGGISNESNFYRPLQMLTYALDYRSWGLDPFGYHLTNILLHICVGLCLYWLIGSIFPDRLLALTASLLYIAHPVHVEAVASIAGRADPLSAMFILLSLIFYVKADSAYTLRSHIAALLCFVFALLSKESSVILPLALLMYHYVFRKKINRALFFSVLSAGCVYILARAVSWAPSAAGNRDILSLCRRIPGFFAALAAYARILFIPAGLRAYYGNHLFTLVDGKVILGALIFCLSLFFAFRNRRKDPLLSFSIFWFFIFLLPASNIYPTNDSFMKEHWMYLPSAGFFLIAARWLLSLYRNKKTRIAGLASIMGALVVYPLCAIRQNDYWSDPVVFFERTLRYEPGYPVFHNQLGLEYAQRGELDAAIRNYRKALETEQNFAGMYDNLGFAYQKAGKFEEAISAFRQALGKNPEDVLVYYIIADCYDKSGNKEKSEEWRARAKEENAKLVRSYYDLGNTYNDAGDNKKAIAAYTMALDLDPGNVALLNALAYACILDGKYGKAVVLLENAEKIAPALGLTYNNLAVAFYYQRKYGLAVTYCDKAIERGYAVNPKLLGFLKPYRK